MHLTPVGEMPEKLTKLLNYLQSEYYTRLESLCEQASKPLAELPGESYAALSQNLIYQIEQYMRLRRFGLIPYIHDLLEKEDSGHDCRDCSSNCDLKHSSQVSAVRDAHEKIKEALSRLQSATIQADAALNDSPSYRSLRPIINQLEPTLTELLYIEDSSLIPLIIEAQTAIHARS